MEFAQVMPEPSEEGRIGSAKIGSEGPSKVCNASQVVDELVSLAGFVCAVRVRD